jgi:hypothetical protein
MIPHEMSDEYDDALARRRAAEEGVPFLSADELPSTPPVIKGLSSKFLRQAAICPLAVEGARVTVAVADPSDPVVGDELRQILGGDVRLCAAPREAILAALERAYGATTPLPEDRRAHGGRDAWQVARRSGRRRRHHSGEACRADDPGVMIG